MKTGEFAKQAPTLGASNEEDLFIKIGYGKLLAMEVARQLSKAMGGDVEVEKEVPETGRGKVGSAIRSMFQSAAKKTKHAPVRVEGIDNILIRFAKCCNPIPGEDIIGFVSRGRGLSVHSTDCEKALTFDPDRKVEIDWVSTEAREFRAGIRVLTEDRPGVLAQITRSISSLEGDITSANVATTRDKKGRISIELVVRNLKHLQDLMNGLERIEGVISVERIRV